MWTLTNVLEVFVMADGRRIIISDADPVPVEDQEPTPPTGTAALRTDTENVFTDEAGNRIVASVATEQGT